MATATDRIVFEATHDWWQIRGKDFVLDFDDGWDDRMARAAAVAGIDTDDEESSVRRIAEVGEEHTAIRPGDYLCCQGVGDDVIFVRLAD